MSVVGHEVLVLGDEVSAATRQAGALSQARVNPKEPLGWERRKNKVESK